jgi:hypothetical protein
MVAVIEVAFETVCDVVDLFQSDLFRHLSGPCIGKPSKRSLQLFFMVCYDTDRFREFVVSEGFTQLYEIPADEMKNRFTEIYCLLRTGIPEIAYLNISPV